MAKIVRVEGLMVDLKPKVKRVDAIQSFVSQETPILRITDADGAVGTGYSYTIGTGGPAILSLIETHAGAGADRPRGRHDRADLARPPVPHPRHLGRRDHLAGAGRDRYRALGPEGAQGRPAACMCWPAARRTRSGSTPRRAAGCTCETGGDRRGHAQGEGERLRRRQDEDRPADPRGRVAARRRARGGRRRLRDLHRRQPGLFRRRGHPPGAPL